MHERWPDQITKKVPWWSQKPVARNRGRKTFGQATLILLVDAARRERALARREPDIHRGVLGEPSAWCQ